MESTTSRFVPSAKDPLREDEYFVSRKRANEDAREFYGTKLFNENLVVKLFSVFPV